MFFEHFQAVIHPPLPDELLHFYFINSRQVSHPHDTGFEVIDFGLEGLVGSVVNELEDVFDVWQQFLVGLAFVEVAAVQDAGECLHDVVAEVLCVVFFTVIHRDRGLAGEHQHVHGLF
jgi:hypothetical protein